MAYPALVATVEVARRTGLWRVIALALVAAVGIPILAAAAFLAAALDAIASNTYKPTQMTTMAAYLAASRCNFSPEVKLSTGLLVAMAHQATSDGLLGFGHYRNPLAGGDEDGVPPDILAHVDRSQLRTGGFTHSMLALPGEFRPADWTTVLPNLKNEHGIGFLLIDPETWRQGVSEVPGGSLENLDPFKPYDALLVAACHFKHLEAGARGTLEGLQQAVLRYGEGVVQFVDLFVQVLSQDRDRPWQIPTDLLSAMPLWGPARGGAYWQRLQAELGIGSVAAQWEPSGLAQQDIPPEYLALYRRWAPTYGEDWTVLAGVGKVECDHGRSAAVGCHRGEQNSAGAMGPMQFLAGTWQQYGVDGNGDGRKDIYDPQDAVPGAANYLKHLGLDNPDSIRAALCHYNAGFGAAYSTCMQGSSTYADQVMSWAQKYQGAQAGAGSLNAVLPIPGPGWIQPIPLPAWPPDLARHMSPGSVTNQCVAGALATWAVTHQGQWGEGRWSPPPLLPGNAIDMYGDALLQHFQTRPRGQPVVGSMVVFGSAYGTFGHVATVVAVQGDRFEVIEQNVLAHNANLEYHWGQFDLRSVASSDASVVGFVVAPS